MEVPVTSYQQRILITMFVDFGDAVREVLNFPPDILELKPTI